MEKTSLRKNRSPVLHKPHNLSKHLPLAPNLAQVLISRALDQLRGDCPYCPVSHHRNVHQDSPCTDGLNNLVPERYLPLKMPGTGPGRDLTPCNDNTCRSRYVRRSAVSKSVQIDRRPCRRPTGLLITGALASTSKLHQAGGIQLDASHSRGDTRRVR